MSSIDFIAPGSATHKTYQKLPAFAGGLLVLTSALTLGMQASGKISLLTCFVLAIGEIIGFAIAQGYIRKKLATASRWCSFLAMLGEEAEIDLETKQGWTLPRIWKAADEQLRSLGKAIKGCREAEKSIGEVLSLMKEAEKELDEKSEERQIAQKMILGLETAQNSHAGISSALREQANPIYHEALALMVIPFDATIDDYIDPKPSALSKK